MILERILPSLQTDADVSSHDDSIPRMMIPSLFIPQRYNGIK
jgi:hypothetical protein